MATYLDELVQKIVTKADLKGFDDLERKLKRAIKLNDLLAKSFRRAFGIFFGIQGIRSVIQTTRDLDLLQKSIKGLTGSTQDWQYLREEAYRTGTSLKTIAGAYKNFYSAARGSGFNGTQIQGMFSGLLTAGRGIGASQQQIGGALVALEQMLSKGKVSAEELRKQLGNALPGAVEIAQRAMGVTGAQFEEMMKKGISATEFVPKFITQAEKELGKGFKENIKSLDFALVNLNTAWMEFQANILHGEAGEALAQLVRDITGILRSEKLLKFVQMIGKGLVFIFKHLKLIMVLFGYKKIMDWIIGLESINKAVISLEKGIKGLASATNLLYLKWAMILGVLLLIQDIIMGIMNPNADTYYNDLFRRDPEDYDVVPGSENSIGGPVYKDPEAGLTVADKMKRNKEIFKDINKKGATISNPEKGLKPFIREGILTGGAAPLINTDVPIPNSGYINTLPNLNGNYSNSDTKSSTNHISISITAPNSQPETIAANVEDVLQKFFTKYEMGYA